MPELLDASVCQPRFAEIERRCHIQTKHARVIVQQRRLNEMN